MTLRLCYSFLLQIAWMASLLGITSSAIAQPTGYTLHFDKNEYLIEPGATFPVQVLISPIPEAGLYSFGVMLVFSPTDARVGGPAEIAVPGQLSFDGVRGDGPVKLVDVDAGAAAVKGTVNFAPQVPTPYTGAALATFQVKDLAPASYRLELRLFNTLGPTEEIFVDGNGVPLDSLLSFGTARVNHLSRGWVVEILTAPKLNFQNGLYEQFIRVINGTPLTPNSLDIQFPALPPGIALYNAYRGVTPPILYLADPPAPGRSIDLKVEYHVADRKPFAQPEITTVASSLERPLPDVTGFQPEVVIRGAIVRDGTFLVEFDTLAGETYAIFYTEDVVQPVVNWRLATPLVVGTGGKVQWIDNGPPKTSALPNSLRQRFYKRKKLAN